MTTTVNIPEDVLERAMRLSQARSPQEAIVKALEEYARRHDQSQLIPLLGTSETLASADEIQRLRDSE